MGSSGAAAARLFSSFRITVAVFLAVAVMLIAVHGHRVVATNDEGILLDAAQKVAGGERPYVDFWAYMSPGSYWLQAGVFRLFGVSLLTGRIVVIFDFALQCALVFWLTSRLASRWTAGAVMLMFTGFQMADPAFLTAQHRWDSVTLALLGMAVAMAAGESKPRWILSGALLAAAAWSTPTDAFVGMVVASWIWWDRMRRPALAPFLGGIAAVSLPAIVWLAASHSLVPFVQQMLWLRKNYLVNAMPYGSIIGGYRALFTGSAGGIETAIRSLLVVCIALPAILPFAALVGWGFLLWRSAVPERAQIFLMLGCAGALILALSPRPDVGHLAFVVALPYVLASAAVSRLLPARAWAFLAMFGVLFAGIFASNSFASLRSTSHVASPVGDLMVDNAQREALQGLVTHVRPGESMFVFPYMPMHYFVTQTKNPTAYSFFSPGMATRREELAALAELQARPPEWVMYMRFTIQDVLRIVPHLTTQEWKYAALGEWIERNYQPVENPGVTVSGYQLLKHKADENGTAASLTALPFAN